MTNIERLLNDVSDDWFALWEIDQLLSRSAPELDGSARQELVRDLLKKGALQLSTASEWSAVRDAPAMSIANALIAVASPSTWAVPGPGDAIFAVTAT